MIDDAPLLTMREDFSRPAAGLVEGFRGIAAAAISDAMGCSGGIGQGVGPLLGLPNAFVGIAVTCYCGPGDNLAAVAASTLVGEGDVLVAATDGYSSAAVAGDIMVGTLRNRGAAAFVTDGAVRDLADLRRIGLPVFARGATPQSAHRSGPGTVGLPIVCAGVPVSPGDILVGDLDGVVVVPRESAALVLERARAIRDQEARLAELVESGRRDLPDAVLVALSNRVLRLD